MLQKASSVEFSGDSENSALSKQIFRIPSIKRMMVARDYVCITKSKDSDWEQLKQEIFKVLLAFFKVDDPKPAVSYTLDVADKNFGEEDSIESLAQEILVDQVRPTFLENGADLSFISVEGENIKLSLRGSYLDFEQNYETIKQYILSKVSVWLPIKTVSIV